MFFIIFLALLPTGEGYMKVDEEFLECKNMSTLNWTGCQEFLMDTTFEVDSVIDVDWVIFYYWSPNPESSYHVRFSLPTPMLIDRFRLELNDVIRPSVNWSHADLFVETSIDLSGLFIRTNSSGVFRFIPSFTFHFHFTPYVEVALKLVDGYLSMMNCKQKGAYALAPVEKMPNPLEIESKAAIFGIQNPLGRSYLTKNPYDPPEAALKLSDLEEEREEYHGTDLTANLIF